MEIREDNSICILTPLSPIIDRRESARILPILQEEEKEVALDLSFVSDCTIDFIEGLKQISKTKSVGVFNIPQDMFVLFNIMDLDKSIKLFVSETDFMDGARRLVNRKFSVVKAS